MKKNNKRKALITGITGQDGSYLAEFLLSKGYHVFGIQRRVSSTNTQRIDHLYDNPKYPDFVTIYGDLSDSSNILSILATVKPDEIYNLGAQSNVKLSFNVPEYTVNISGLGAIRILDAIVRLRLPAKFYQASSSEMFGQTTVSPQDEKTPFNPQSPYALAKVMAFQATKIYRKSYGVFAVNGILFNHESPRRGITFVTRKITQGFSRIKLGIQNVLKLGNLEAKRDWGYAKDYVEGIYLMMQQKKADDFVLATGETYSVREFAEKAAAILNINLQWKGKGIREKGIDKKSGRTIVEIDPAYFRPAEVDYLRGNPSKARQILGWKSKVTFGKLVEIMVKSDYDLIRKEVKTGRKIAVRRLETGI